MAFSNIITKLDALNPLSVLSRGFTVTKTSDGKMLQSVSNIKTGDEISTVLNDGIIKSVVLETERK